MKKILLLFIFTSLSISLNAQTTGNFMFEGVLRDYILRVPASYNAAQPTPLVINMHGYTSNASQQMFYSAFHVEANAAGYIVVYPNGIATQWNIGQSGAYHSGINDVGFISALIDSMAAKYNIDPCRVFSTGMSNGGFMSYRLACQLENKIAAIASVTGSMTDSMMFYCQSARPVPVMEIHGTADAIVNYNGTPNGYNSVDQNLQFWVEKNSCTGSPTTVNLPDIAVDGTTVTKFSYTNCVDSTEVIAYRVNGGGHTWAGASPIAGVTTQDIKANVEIINFFNKHPRCSTTLSAGDVAMKESPALKIFPNPVISEMNVSTTLKGNISVYVKDVLGKMVFSIENWDKHSFVLGDDITGGVYILELNNGGHSIRDKFMKK